MHTVTHKSELLSGVTQDIAADSGKPELLRDFMTRPELAEALGVAVRTVERWHVLREGPPRVRMGQRVLYRRDAVRQWLLSRERDDIRAA